MTNEKEGTKEERRVKRAQEKREATGSSSRSLQTSGHSHASFCDDGVRQSTRSRTKGSSSRSLQTSGHSHASSGDGVRRGTRSRAKSSSSRSLQTSGHSHAPSGAGLRRGIQSSGDLRARDRARRSGLSSSRHGSHRTNRSEEDRLAKGRSRRAGNNPAKPGAHAATTADESSQARQKSRTDRSPRTNRSDANGRTALSSSRHGSRRTNRSEEDRLAKDRARGARSKSPAKPGAHTASNADESDRARRKSRSNREDRNRNKDRDAKIRAKNGGGVPPKERDVVVDPVEQPADDTGAVGLKAMAVEDVENEQLKEQQAQIEALKQQMQNMAQPNHGSDPDTDDTSDVDDTNEDNEQHSKKRAKCIAGIFFLLLAIGGGVAGYILGNPKKSPTEALQLDVGPTNPPTTAGGNTTAIQLPSTSPSNSPTELQIYTPPSKEDCEAIASGSTLSDQTTLTSRQFVIEFDATLNSQMAEEDWVGPLKEQLQSIFLPVVAGCSTRRWLRETKSKQHRQLQLLPDFAIANGKIGDAIVTEGGCEDESAAALCHRVSVLMDLSLRDEDTKLTFVEAYLITTLRALPDNVLGLGTLLSNLVVVRAAPTSPTDEPSISPSFTPTTVQPTDAPSSQPSLAPVVGPTTLEPTRSPTKAPTKAPVAAPILSTENPTASPTKAPVVAPTLAPVAGPTTPPPTQVPTKGPSVPPSKVPTELPTASPTSTPTQEPTIATLAPTISTSLSPSSVPSLLALAVPTVEASVVPTAVLSSSPTLQASQNPTVMTSVITPSATALQSSEYYCPAAVCAGDRSGHLLPGTPAGEASNAIDGNTDGNYFSGSSSHTWTQWNPYWQVQGIAGPVSTVRVWNRNDGETGHLVGAAVDLLDSNGEVLATREIQGVATFWEFEFDSISGVDKVQVSHRGLRFIILAEVEVLGGSSGGSLLTESSVASQSSSLNCDACIHVPHFSAGGPASLAIDGNRNSPAHTHFQVDPWWQVDLQLTATVSMVIVWGRPDCCNMERLVGAKIQLKDSSGNILHTETITGDGVMSTFEFPHVEDVVAIRIALDSSPEYSLLNIVQVEAFGFIQ
ncbi:unnamed protein product [Cylindrotheca closterium]|uniref:F5/8 type C domain-containing protein n=1 Tax=Cylindrotheca closterium TaxID=2856 RepID=A0AAD2CXS0_9STRA|nr:unnamed protein product [Cylindrotheca closterium]